MLTYKTNGWVTAALSPVAFIIMGAASPATTAGDAFSHVFSTAGEPAFIHYRVMYRGPDGIHHLEVWRDHDRRIKRTTDGKIASFAVRDPKGAGYGLAILDYQKKIHTDVSRDNLYRLGEMADWYDLGHGLRHPTAAYTLVPGKAPGGLPTTPAPCRWYDLSTGGRVTRICWDGANHLPLLMSAGGRLVWRVTALATAPIPASVFAINDRGFVRNNADNDIAGD